jgi:hypothetical protein
LVSGSLVHKRSLHTGFPHLESLQNSVDSDFRLKTEKNRFTNVIHERQTRPVNDRESRSYSGHIPFMEIPERLGGWLAKQALSDAPAGVLALLNRYLGDPWQRLPILLRRSRISN